MIARPVLSLAALLIAILVAPAARGLDDPLVAADRAYQAEVRPLLQKYCYNCHGGGQQKGGLDLEAVADARGVLGDRDRWELVAGLVRDGEMPPPGGKNGPPTEAEIDTLAGWVESTLTQVDCDLRQPGSVTLRRLNRAEYNNTIRDLLGIDFRPADSFPADDVGYGFDNIGDVLTLDPLLFEKYLVSAEEIARQAIDIVGPSSVPSKSYRDDALRDGGERHDQGRILAGNGEISIEHDFPAAGRYVFGIRAFGNQAGDEPVRMALLIDGQVIEEIRVEADRRPRRHEVVTRVPAGRKRVAVAFLNDFADETLPEGNRDRNLILTEIQIAGPGDPTEVIEVEDLPPDAGGTRAGEGRVLASTATLRVPFRAAGPGEYRFQIRAFGDQAGPDPVLMGVKVGDVAIEAIEVTATDAAPAIHEVRLAVEAGEQVLELSFLNDYYDQENRDEKLRGDRNLHITKVIVTGPVEGYYQRVPAAQRMMFARPILSTDESEATRAALRAIADRAFRRPATDDELDRLAGLAAIIREEGGSIEEGLRFALEAILVSPSFLFRAEFGAPATSEADAQSLTPIGDYELAARLSYFLWSSTPDDELLRAAREGELRTPDGLEAQARRLLADPRSRALVDNFATQWLQIRLLDQINPDPDTFPKFNDRLRAAMRTETELFVESVIREDRSILDLLESDYTFLNERLAKHYGIRTVEGEEFRRVELPADKNRGGLLTQASVLTITSNPTRTSPVKRGRWVLEQILGTPPPPPPPDVPPLPEEGPEVKGTVRQRLEIHRSNPGCALCHERMDPIGFGLENYDAVGAWRNRDGEETIDASGVFPGGESFAGPADLRAILRGRSDDFARCLAEKMMTYALGRGLEYYDRCAIDKMLSGLESDGYRFSRLVAEVVRSDPFRFRQAEGSE